MDYEESKELVDILIMDSVINAVSYYGVEGCEDAIKRVYSEHSEIQVKMLAVLHDIYKY